jgi:hypothetical protein
MCSLPVGTIVAEERSVRRPNVDTFIILVVVVLFVFVGVVGVSCWRFDGRRFRTRIGVVLLLRFFVTACRTHQSKHSRKHVFARVIRFRTARGGHSQNGDVTSTLCLGKRKGKSSSSRCRKCENRRTFFIMGWMRNMHSLLCFFKITNQEPAKFSKRKGKGNKVQERFCPSPPPPMPPTKKQTKHEERERVREERVIYSSNLAAEEITHG